MAGDAPGRDAQRSTPGAPGAPLPDAGDPPSLEIEDLVWGHDHPVAGPLRLRLTRGQRIGLTGPNGAGKSSLLATILGRATVHAGRFTVHARPIACQPQTPVRYSQMPWTGHELLAVCGAAPAQVPAAIRALLDQRVDRLSGGQLQLLGVVSVLCGPATLVLLDEPTSYLDRGMVDIVAQALQAMPTTRSALVVSHDRAFLEATCTRVVHIDGLVGTARADD